MTEQHIFNLAYAIFEQCKKARHDQLVKVYCDIEKDKAIIRIVRDSPFTKYYIPIEQNRFVMYFESWDTLETIYRRVEHRITN